MIIIRNRSMAFVFKLFVKIDYILDSSINIPGWTTDDEIFLLMI